MRLDIFSDTVCPWCFIGKRRLEAALRDRPQPELTITWRAFQLNPDMPEGGMDRQTYLSTKFGGADQARQIYEQVAAAGAATGIPFRFDRIETTPNTIESHRLLHLAGREGVQDGVAEALFQAYFIDGQNIGDRAVLSRIGLEHGLDPDGLQAYLDSQDGRRAVLTEDASARNHGIQGVPCFVFDGKYVVSGAQQPEVFHQVFDLVRQSAKEDA